MNTSDDAGCTVYTNEMHVPVCVPMLCVCTCTCTRMRVCVCACDEQSHVVSLHSIPKSQQPIVTDLDTTVALASTTRTAHTLCCVAMAFHLLNIQCVATPVCVHIQIY